MTFKNRQEAGQKLVSQLEKYRGNYQAIILGLPRGGVVTASVIAQELKLPLDLIVPRKIGAPGNSELAIGAITEDGEGIFDESLIRAYQISQDYINREIEQEKQEAKRRLKVYRADKKTLDLKDKIAILVDDGVATGATMQGTIKSVKKKGAAKVVVAVPVISQEALMTLKKETEEVIYLDRPAFFGAVGEFYEDFSQVEDEEVIKRFQMAD